MQCGRRKRVSASAALATSPSERPVTARSLPSQKYLRECLRYDEELGALFWLERPSAHFKDGIKHTAEHISAGWNAKYAGARYGCIVEEHQGGFYRTGQLDGQRWPEHRLIWRLLTGDEPQEIDHRNSDGLNNKIGNLRDATKTQNARNQRGWRARALPKGVHKPKHGRLVAQITTDRRLIYLGRFDTPEEAHAAYCEAARRLHGEFANFGH